MKIPITKKEEKLALLKALQTGVLDTDEVPELKRVLNEMRPDLQLSELSDEELDARIAELEKKLGR